jgi:hypothetical protein
MTDLLDIAKWAKGNPELLKRNPEIVQMLGNSEASVSVSKYRNVRTKDPDGEVYDSGKEAADAVKFSQAVRAGEYILYKHHVMINLPGSIKMELDHFLVNNQMQIEIYDSKSSDGQATKTRDWVNKKKLFEATYGIKIGII